MLRVDRQDPPSPLLPRGRRELAARDEAFLVGEREVDSPLERPERGRQPCEAHDRVEDDIRLRTVEELGEVAADLGERGETFDVLRSGRGGTSSSSGWAPMISSACVPIEPVAPRSATRFMRRV